jgi:DNA modification methylase
MDNISESLLPLAVGVDTLQEDPRNARKHSTKNVDAIRQSLITYGQRKPIVVNKNTGVIEAGNGLYQAAKSLGWTQIAAVIVEDDPATATGFAIMDNRSAELSDWDETILKSLLLELENTDFEMSATGFQSIEIEEVLSDIRQPKVGLTDDDEVPEPEAPICQSGDLWLLGNHKLLCGDSTDSTSLELLMGAERADLVITDPPYNVGYKTQSTKNNKIKDFDDKWSLDTYHLLLTGVVNNIYKYTKDKAAVYMWYASSYSDIVVGTLRQFGYSNQPPIIWLKDGMIFSYSTYHRTYEPCAYAFKDGHKPYYNMKITAKQRDVWMNMDRITFMDYLDVWYIQRDNSKEYKTPTQKPVALTERMLRNNSLPGHLILDTFGGSGSVLIGCEKWERACRVIELDPHNCDVIINRWQNYTGEKAVKIYSRQKDEVDKGCAGTNMPAD